MLAATLRTLAAAGYMKGEERINRRQIALDCAGILLERPVDVLDVDMIERQAMIVAELRSQLFSDNGYGEEVEKDLDLLLGSLVAADGSLQQLLDEQVGDKYVLCSKRVTRQMIGLDGQVTMTLKRSGKFVSRNPDVVNTYYWQEALARYDRSTSTLKKRMELGMRRQPELAAKRPELVVQAHKILQRELPAQLELPVE